MSRAFYIPPQTPNFNATGNSELVDMLIATLLTLIQQRRRGQQCTRRCCARLLYQDTSNVSFIKYFLVNCELNKKNFHY